MTLRVHIETLVLDGLAVEPHRATAVRDAVQRELARLLASGGLEARLRAGDAAPPGPAVLQLRPGAGAAALGADIARTVHGQLGGRP